MEGKIKNADICNEFSAAFSNAFINSAENKLLQDKYRYEKLKNMFQKTIIWLSY